MEAGLELAQATHSMLIGMKTKSNSKMLTCFVHLRTRWKAALALS